MAKPFPTLDVAVVLIGRDGRLLLDYNNDWSCFCLPVTKIRDLLLPVPESTEQPEAPLDAAIRAAVEVLGRPLAPNCLPQSLAIAVPPYQQSGRDGQWKRYQFHVFGLKIDFTPQPLAGHTAVWLAPKEMRSHRPLSPTALHVLEATPEQTLLALLI